MPQEKAKQLYQFLIYTTIFCLKKVPIVGAAVEFAADWQNNVKIQLNQQANLKVQERLAQIEQAMLCLPDEVRKMAQEMIAEQRRLGVEISPEQEEAVLDLASSMPAAIRERTQATLRQARQHGTALHTVLPVGEQVSTQERAEFYQSLLPARRSAFRENDWLPHRNPPWQLVQLLGAGGFGEVWEARHPQLNDRFAVKFCQDEASAKVLKQEAAALFRLRKELPEHPNIVRLLDLQLDKEPYWLAFEYVPGGTLEALMRGAALTWQEVLAIFLPIVEGMSAVHKVGIVHRDLKPANILLTEAGVPKITDFGIGKVMEEQERTRLTMSIFGSAGYTSPEQKRGLPAHPADDTYALGVLLWQLVTHTLQPPEFVRDSLGEFNIPDVAKTLIIDCWEKPRAKRPQQAEELLKVLQSLLFVTHEKARRKAEEDAKQAQRKAEEAKLAKRKAEEEARLAKRKAEEEARLAKRKAEEEAQRAIAAEVRPRRQAEFSGLLLATLMYIAIQVFVGVFVMPTGMTKLINLCFIVAPIAYVALRQYSVIISTPPGRYAVHWGVSLKQDHERYVVTLMQNIQHFQLVWMVFVALLIAGNRYSAPPDYYWYLCFLPGVMLGIVLGIFIVVIRSIIKEMKMDPSFLGGGIFLIFLAGFIGLIAIGLIALAGSSVEYQLLMDNVIILQLLAPTAIWLGIKK